MYPASVGLGAAELVASYSEVGDVASGGKISILIDTVWDIGYIANLSSEGRDLWPGFNRGTLWFPTTASLTVYLSAQLSITFNITPNSINQDTAYTGLTLAVCLFRLNK